MENLIDIKNVADTVFFSTISKGMFCEHRLKGHGLTRIDDGTLLIESPDFRLEAGRGSYVFWRRDCTASLKKLPTEGRPFRSVTMNLSRDFLKGYFAEHLSQSKLPSKATSLPVPAVKLKKTDALKQLFATLASFETHPDDLGQTTLHGLLSSAVECLLKADERFYPTLFDFYETWKIDLLDFMEHHFTESLTMGEFASYTGRSLATFKRDFEKISSLSPERWIMEQRLMLARQLMKDEGAKPKEAFLATGFKNRSHFSASFKRRFGYTPSQLTQQIANAI